MKIELVEQGQGLPDTLLNFKTYMRVTSGDIEDSDLTRMITAATRACEAFARIAILPNEYRCVYRVPYVRAGFGAETTIDPDNIRRRIKLKPVPVRELSTTPVVLLDERGVRQTVPDYRFDKTPPSAQGDAIKQWVDGSAELFWQERDLIGQEGWSLRLGVKGGYSAAEGVLQDVPDEIIHAVKETASFFYENRGENIGEDDSTDASIRMVPGRAKQLLNKLWRPVGLGI